MADTIARELPELIRTSAEPLPDIDDDSFAAFFDRFADARVICLGEASHGTSEFYRMRARITQRLIEDKGFNIVAAEADWPDAARIDHYVRHSPTAFLLFAASDGLLALASLWALRSGARRN